MVEYILNLDLVFGSLADPTRRDIIDRLQSSELNVSEIAEPYDMSLAAISKHLKILEKANLIRKRRQGKQQLVRVQPDAVMQAAQYLQQYERLWNERLDRLDQFLKEE